jgi:hypothetical protein
MKVGDTVYLVSGQRPEVLTGIVAELERDKLRRVSGVRVGDQWWTASRVYIDPAAARAEHADERAEWLAFLASEDVAERKLLARHGLTA